MALYPPFSIPECDPPPQAAARSTADSTKGNTIQQTSPPVAEFKIHYETQFRFARFYSLSSVTPYWENSGTGPDSQDQVTRAVSGSPDGWLPADDRFVHLDDEKIENSRREEIPTNYQIRVNKGDINIAMGESLQVAADTGARKLIWVPLNGTLPAHVSSSVANWKRATIYPSDSPGMDGVPGYQWGIRGTLDITMDPCGAKSPTYSYKMVCVWERSIGIGSPPFTLAMAILPTSTDLSNPTICAGFPRSMSVPASKQEWSGTEEEWLETFPAIQVRNEWAPVPPPKEYGVSLQNPDGAGWLDGVRAWRVKLPTTWKLTDAVCIHTGNQPNWFTGCQGPGEASEQTEWGFTTRDHSKDTMWKILGYLGVSRKQFKEDKTSPPANHRRWVVIRTTANPDAIADDGWRKQTIWLPQSIKARTKSGKPFDIHEDRKPRDSFVRDPQCDKSVVCQQRHD